MLHLLNALLHLRKRPLHSPKGFLELTGIMRCKLHELLQVLVEYFVVTPDRVSVWLHAIAEVVLIIVQIVANHGKTSQEGKGLNKLLLGSFHIVEGTDDLMNDFGGSGEVAYRCSTAHDHYVER